MSELILKSFKFFGEDISKLDVIVSSYRSKAQEGCLPLRINRTTVLQNLIYRAHLEVMEEEAKVASSLEKVKMKARKVIKAVQK